MSAGYSILQIYLHFFIFFFYFLFFGHTVQLAVSDQFSDQGLNLCTQQLKHKVLTIGLPGNSLNLWLSVRFSGLETQGQHLQLARFVE